MSSIQRDRIRYAKQYKSALNQRNSDINRRLKAFDRHCIDEEVEAIAGDLDDPEIVIRTPTPSKTPPMLRHTLTPLIGELVSKLNNNTRDKETLSVEDAAKIDDPPKALKPLPSPPRKASCACDFGGTICRVSDSEITDTSRSLVVTPSINTQQLNQIKALQDEINKLKEEQDSLHKILMRVFEESANWRNIKCAITMEKLFCHNREEFLVLQRYRELINGFLDQKACELLDHMIQFEVKKDLPSKRGFFSRKK